MKKRICALMITAIAFGLVACDNSAKQMSGEEVIITEDNQGGDSAVETSTEDIVTNIGNPWTATDKQGVLDATGFYLEAPEGASEANYSYMAEGKMAQLTYIYEGADWVYRIQPTDVLTDISGMNFTWISDEPGKVADMDAEYMGYSEQAEDSEYIDDMFFVQVVNWYDDASKATYSLSVSGRNIDGMDIECYAEQSYLLSHNN